MGLLYGAEKKVFEEHLRSCALCQKEMQVEGALDKVLSARLDPGEIETYILSRVRLLKNIQPKVSWLYVLQIGSYVAAAITLLWVFMPMIISLMAAGGEGIARLLESYPAMPSNGIPAGIVGIGIIFALTSGLLAWRMMRE